MGIRIDRVYTKTGDEGDTSLVGGTRVSKSHVRIQTYGTVDELNAYVGLCQAYLAALSGTHNWAPDVRKELDQIQQDLFDLGSDLATPVNLKNAQAKLKDVRACELEAKIDEWQADLAPLSSFVLPGGSVIPASLHVCRTVCRRAERWLVVLLQQEKILGPGLVYLNRLSDYFFVLSRHVARCLGEPEILWRY